MSDPEPPSPPEAISAFRQLFERSTVCAAVLHRDGHLDETNPAFDELVGPLADDMGRRPFAAVIHPEDLQTALLAAAQAWATGGAPGVEVRMRKADGTYQWMSVSASRDRTGDRLIAIGHEVTDRKAQERQLGELVRTFELAGEIAQIGYWRADLRSRTVTWSDWMYRLFGWDRTVAKPDILSVVGTFHSAEIQRLRGIYLQALVTGEPFTFERRLARPDGAERWIATRGQAEKDARGTTIGVFGVVQDITDRKASEQRIARLAMVASKTRAAVIITDARGRVEWVNDGFTKLTGYAPDEVVGRFPWNLVDGPDVDREVLRVIRATLEQGEPVEAELVMYTKDREARWVDLEIQPVRDSEGTIASYIALETDITARKRSEAELQRAHEAAVEASRLKSQFLANMSHEIRTPMNGILGMTELLLQTALSEEQRTGLESIMTGGQHLLDLLGDILDISKIEAGRLELSRVPFELPRTLDDIVKTHAARAQEKGLTLALDIDPEMPTEWLGDPLRVAQVTANLIGNALKFTARGGIRVAAEVDTLGPEGHPTGIVIAVHDSGIGIPREKQEAIFLPFFQVDGSAARRYGGTGLGLAICRQLAEAMGGHIRVESTVGVGSTFRLHLPLTPTAASPRVGALPRARRAVPPPNGSPAVGRTLSLLVAEDHPTNAFVLRRMLERDGHRVVEAATGNDAVQTARAGGLDAILMDVQMPDMDGLEATRLIRIDEAARGTFAVPIVAVTANAMSGDAGRCLAAGMTHYLPKPVALSALRELLAQLM